MNNSRLVIDTVSLTTDTEEKIDRTPWLRQREQELIKVIEAITRINDSDDWRVLKSEVFEGLEESLLKRLNIEAERPELNQPEIHRLQGQLIWAKKYADFKSLGEFFKMELQGIRKQLKK